MNDQINQIIRTIGENGHISIDSNNQYLFRAALRLESENILRRNEKNFYFKDIGQYIYKLGSYEKYQIELDEQKQHQKRLDDATIKSSEATVDAAQSAKGSHSESIKSRKASYASAIFAFIAIVISIYQCKEENEFDEKYNQISSKIDSLTKIQAKTQPQQTDSTTPHKATLNKKQ